MKTTISTENLYFSYGQESSYAINNVNIQINKGEFISIIGHSGCGKSTLLRILTGLEPSYKGDVLIDGKRVRSVPENLSVIFQENSLFPWMTAEKNIEFAVRQVKKLPKKEAREVARDILKRVGLEKDGDKYPCKLSGGMKQRVAIARALSVDSEIMFMDEPFSALDIKMKKELQKLIINLWQERPGKLTIVMVTHDVDEAILLSDRIFFMDKGEITHEFKVTCKRPRDFDSQEAPKVCKELKRNLTNIFNGRKVV